MKILKLLGIALAVLVVLCGAGAAWLSTVYEPDLKPGSAAPDLALATPDGGALSLASLRGKVVLLDFWSST